MILKIGSIGTIRKAFGTLPREFREVTNPINNVIKDTVSISSKRVKTLDLLNSEVRINHLFRFLNNGEIKTMERVSGSKDLEFLEHIKNGKYTPPKTKPQGNYPISEAALKQSNELAHGFIDEKTHLIDGFRYNGKDAVFDIAGNNISRFRHGNQEIDIIDKTIDTTLNKTIQAFKKRLEGKNLTDVEKMDELMKFIDEVFSVEKSGSALESLVSNMHSSQLKEVLLGDVINSGAGVCRHRSLLTKLLGDEIGLKTRFIEGYYNNGGHAWNEITSANGQTYLFDAMHRNIFDISNTSKNITPQIFHYKTDDIHNCEKLVSKYFNQDSTVGLIYRSLRYKQPIKTSAAELVPTNSGYLIKPNCENISVNGKKIYEETQVQNGDWIQIKDIGFQII